MKKQTKYTVITNLIIIATLAVLLTATLAGGGDLQQAVGNAVKKPYYRGNTSTNKVSLMINVYWGTEYVLPMAELFLKYGFGATFFIGGSWAAENADVVRALSDKGFELGNHGYSHKDAKQLSLEGNRKELMVTNSLLREITGSEPVKLYAPPSGSYGDVVLGLCADEGFEVIMWTRDTVDWRDKDSATVYNRATKAMSGGDLILMHPTKHTLEALPLILDYVKANGFEAVTVSENLKDSV